MRASLLWKVLRRSGQLPLRNFVRWAADQQANEEWPLKLDFAVVDWVTLL